MEIAWTIIPILIVIALFLASARVIADVQRPVRTNKSVDVIAIGHQFWWEYRYPGLGVVTANELHVPVCEPNHPTPTVFRLLSAPPPKAGRALVLSQPLAARHVLVASRS